MKGSTRTNLLLLLAVVALAVAPLALGLGAGQDDPFSGADTRAQQAVTQTDPGYRPWFSPLYTPPSGDVASGLFALQAALGAGVVGYYFGVARTRRRLAGDGGSSAAPEDGAG